MRKLVGVEPIEHKLRENKLKMDWSCLMILINTIVRTSEIMTNLLMEMLGNDKNRNGGEIS